MSDNSLIKAATNAALTIDAIYQWIDRIEAAGGATSISGVAECHAFLTSMKKNRARSVDLIVKPLRDALEAQKGGA